MEGLRVGGWGQCDQNRSPWPQWIMQVICPVGQITDVPTSLLDLPVKPHLQKYSSFQNIRIILYLYQSRPTKGAARDRHGLRGRDAVDADAPITNGVDADGEAVWAWHPDAGVKSARRSAGDGGQQARSTGASTE